MILIVANIISRSEILFIYVNLNKIFTNYITPAIDKGLFTVNIPYDLCNDRICLYLKETLGYEVKYIQTGLMEYEYKI